MIIIFIAPNSPDYKIYDSVILEIRQKLSFTYISYFNNHRDDIILNSNNPANTIECVEHTSNTISKSKAKRLKRQRRISVISTTSSPTIVNNNLSSHLESLVQDSKVSVDSDLLHTIDLAVVYSLEVENEPFNSETPTLNNTENLKINTQNSSNIADNNLLVLWHLPDKNMKYP